MKILYVMPLAVSLSGLYFLFKLRFFFIFHPKKTAGKIILGFKGKNAFSSVALALAGTLGVGNIVGVAVGISVGGAGAVFWLFLSSLFAMTIKFCESSLSSDFGDGKGMIGVIAKSFGRHSHLLSMLYAALMLALSFVMGSALQSASIAQCAEIALGISPSVTSVFLFLALLIAIVGRKRKIEKITSFLIPMTTVIYIFLAFTTIIANVERLPNAFLSVVKSAFKPESAAGGIFGFLVSDKIKEGYLRGILSNEAGAGTSSIAHAKNESRDPGSVGVMGMLEVVFDTVILCMLTAFATLVSVDDFGGLTGVGIILSGIGGTLGGVSEYFIFVCIFAFAYSTIICWYYYGSFAYEYLLNAKSGRAFVSLFLISVFLGAYVTGDYLIGVTDFLLLFLSLISLSALIKNSDRIKHLSERSGLLISGE